MAACACNALTGASDLEIGDCTGPECSAEDGGPTTNDATVDDRTTPRDDVVTTTDAPTDSPPGQPSFCTGISFYVRFDDTTTSSDGDTPADDVNANYAPGKFGNGFSYTPPQVIPYDAVPDSGSMPARWDATRGTVALWFKGPWAFPGTLGRSWTRVLDRLQSPAVTGLIMRIDESATPPHMGVEIGPVKAGAPTATFTSSWRVNDWNHLVGTWQTSGAPSLSFTLNGGGPDGGATRFTTNAAWTQAAPVTYFRFGSTTAPIDGVIDDAAVWNRVLSAAEITALYDAGMTGKSLGDVCALPK